MLAAELYGKVSIRLTASEDVLTSYVLSLFRYLSDMRVLEDWLRRARNVAGQSLPIDRFTHADVAFWPRVRLPDGREREPDAVLALGDASGHHSVLVVEAKFHAGLSNQGPGSPLDQDDNAGGLNGETQLAGHQLADALVALSHGMWKRPKVIGQWLTKADATAVLYITAHHAMPVEDIPGSAADVYWLSWRALAEVLEQHGKGRYVGYSPGERNLLNDVYAILRRRKLLSFVNYLEELEPVEPYTRRLFVRSALAPVKPYHRLLAG